MAKKKVSKRSQPRSKSAKESIGKSLRKPTLSYDVGRHANEFVYWGICTLVAPPSLVPKIRQRAFDRLVEAWLPAVATDVDRIHVNRLVFEAQERFSKLLTSAECERWNALAPRIMGETPEFDEDSDALSEWIVPFAGEIARIETELFEHVQRSVNPRHVPIVRLGVLLDRLHRPTHPELVARRVVTALHYAFRPPLKGGVFLRAAKSQTPVEGIAGEEVEQLAPEKGADVSGDAALPDGIWANTPNSAPATYDQQIECLSGEKFEFESAERLNPLTPPFSIYAGGLSNEAAYIRDQYAGVQHALSEIAGSIRAENKAFLPSENYIRNATATELGNFVENWVSALHESPEILGKIVAEFESATPAYGFLGVWVIPRLRRAGRKGFPETVTIKNPNAARLLELMVNDKLGQVSYQAALKAISPTEEKTDDVYKAKSDLRATMAELSLRIKTESSVGYTLAGL